MADIDELKTAFEHAFVAYNSRSLDAFAASWHDDVVQFSALGPFPAVGKAAVRQYHQRMFTHHESLVYTPITPQFLVVGTTGVVWLHFSLTRKPKDAPMSTFFGRSIFTFAKVDGKWLMVAAHYSRLPSGE
jgi:uncharacterized protein (TIGR02246 family)